MKIIVITNALCTFSLVAMQHNPPKTPQEIQQIWYVQQMKFLRKWVDIQETLSSTDYAFYAKQRSSGTQIITKKGDILQR
jgi:hypothetical protein